MNKERKRKEKKKLFHSFLFKIFEKKTENSKKNEKRKVHKLDEETNNK